MAIQKSLIAPSALGQKATDIVWCGLRVACLSRYAGAVILGGKIHPSMLPACIVRLTRCFGIA
jgi:hypothetical protein